MKDLTLELRILYWRPFFSCRNLQLILLSEHTIESTLSSVWRRDVDLDCWAQKMAVTKDKTLGCWILAVGSYVNQVRTEPTGDHFCGHLPKAHDWLERRAWFINLMFSDRMGERDTNPEPGLNVSLSKYEAGEERSQTPHLADCRANHRNVRQHMLTGVHDGANQRFIKRGEMSA